jgi:hypothetical protein
MLGAVAEARSELGHVQGQIDVVETTRFRWLSRFHFLDAEVSAAEQRAEHALKAAENCLGMASEFGQPKYEVRGRLARALALAALDEREPALEESRRAGRLAQAQRYAGLAWRAWWTAYQLSRDQTELEKATMAVGAVADDLDDELRDAFLSAVPVKP